MIWAVLDTNPEGLTRANLRLSRDATSHLLEHSGADGGRLDEFVGVTLGQNRSERLNPRLTRGPPVRSDLLAFSGAQDRDERYCGGDGGIRTLDTPLERITV
jgi:hypothetical protein